MFYQLTDMTAVSHANTLDDFPTKFIDCKPSMKHERGGQTSVSISDIKIVLQTDSVSN